MLDILNMEVKFADDPLIEIRQYLKNTTCYDLMKDSSTLVILESNLLITKGAECLIHYNSLGISVCKNGNFVALLGTNDILLLMNYLYHNTSRSEAEEALQSFTIEQVFKLKRPEKCQYLNVSIHPDVSLFDAIVIMLNNNQFRSAIIKVDPNPSLPAILNYLPNGELSAPGNHCMLSVVSNYRIIRSIAHKCNVKNLNIPAKQLMSIPQFTATMHTSVISAIEMLISSGVNAIPIIDENGLIINVYGSQDILQFVAKHEDLNLNLPIQTAIEKRSLVFEGVHTCSEIDTLGHLLRGFKTQTIHRILVTDGNKKLLGIVRLVDIIRFLVYQD
eukprot:NODE_966_length_2702_cov_0.395697.p1 type:complete len:332 gc:universal NODE_966_length_2702_cov_0.395697:1317-322(-)